MAKGGKHGPVAQGVGPMLGFGARGGPACDASATSACATSAVRRRRGRTGTGMQAEGRPRRE
eukprot:7630177-Alexandrium_andersonii.AAC.1